MEILRESKTGHQSPLTKEGAATTTVTTPSLVVKQLFSLKWTGDQSTDPSSLQCIQEIETLVIL